MNSVEDAELFWRPRLRPAEAERRRAARAAAIRVAAGAALALALGVAIGLAAAHLTPITPDALSLAMAAG